MAGQVTEGKTPVCYCGHRRATCSVCCHGYQEEILAGRVPCYEGEDRKTPVADTKEPATPKDTATPNEADSVGWYP